MSFFYGPVWAPPQLSDAGLEVQLWSPGEPSHCAPDREGEPGAPASAGAPAAVSTARISEGGMWPPDLESIYTGTRPWPGPQDLGPQAKGHGSPSSSESRTCPTGDGAPRFPPLTPWLETYLSCCHEHRSVNTTPHLSVLPAPALPIRAPGPGASRSAGFLGCRQRHLSPPELPQVYPGRL